MEYRTRNTGHTSEGMGAWGLKGLGVLGVLGVDVFVKWDLRRRIVQVVGGVVIVAVAGVNKHSALERCSAGGST